MFSTDTKHAPGAKKAKTASFKRRTILISNPTQRKEKKNCSFIAPLNHLNSKDSELDTLEFHYLTEESLLTKTQMLCNKKATKQL